MPFVSRYARREQIEARQTLIGRDELALIEIPLRIFFGGRLCLRKRWRGENCRSQSEEGGEFHERAPFEQR